MKKKYGYLNKTAAILALLMLLSSCTSDKGNDTDRSQNTTNITDTHDIHTDNEASNAPSEDTSCDDTSCDDTSCDDTSCDNTANVTEATVTDENTPEENTEYVTEDITSNTGDIGNNDDTTVNTDKEASLPEPEEDPTPAHTHTYTSSITKAAICGTDGTKTYTCSCGSTYTETIKATGKHSYTSKVTKTATCGADGVKTYTCGTCGKTYTETIKATGKHSYTSSVTKTATCGTDGVRTYTCGTCGKTYTEAIKATGKHNYVDTVVPAEYYDDGYTQHDCTVCGNSYKDNITKKLLFVKYRTLMAENRYKAIKEYFDEDPNTVVYINENGRRVRMGMSHKTKGLTDIIFCNPIYKTKPFDIEAIKADMIGFGDYLGYWTYTDDINEETSGTYGPVWAYVKGTSGDEKSVFWQMIPFDSWEFQYKYYGLAFVDAEDGNYAVKVLH